MTITIDNPTPNVHVGAEDLVVNKAARKATYTFGEGEKVITFTAAHNPYNKTYQAELAVAESKNGFLVTSYMMFGENPHVLKLDSEPVKRYSLKAFTAFAEAAFAEAAFAVYGLAKANDVIL